MKDARFTSRKGRRGHTPGAVTTADLVVLSLLAERAMHGYELLGEYERQEVADWASVSRAQVYYAIQKLADLGLIEPGERPDPGERDRTVYRPTSAGRAALARELGREDWARARLPQPFATWLGLSIHLPKAEVGRVMAARRAFLDAEMLRERASLAFIRTLTSERARAGEAVVTLVLRQLEVERHWIDECLALARLDG